MILVSNKFVLGFGETGTYSNITIGIEIGEVSKLKRGENIELADVHVLNSIEKELESWIREYEKLGANLSIIIIGVANDSEGRRYAVENSINGVMRTALPKLGIDPPPMFSTEIEF